MAEELQMSKEVKILQGKLDGLDVETLQQLLQAAIACKTKESSERNTFSSLSSETASVVLNQNTNGGVQENSDEVDKNSAEVVGDNGHSQLNCLDNKSSGKFTSDNSPQNRRYGICNKAYCKRLYYRSCSRIIVRPIKLQVIIKTTTFDQKADIYCYNCGLKDLTLFALH